MNVSAIKLSVLVLAVHGTSGVQYVLEHTAEHSTHFTFRHTLLMLVVTSLQDFDTPVLMQAMCKRFTEYCKQHSIPLPMRNFSLEYDTNIPRQAGLSGSSAIACAALNCLLEFYNVQDRYDCPKCSLHRLCSICSHL